MSQIISDKAVKLTFALLLARHANDPIANASESQFGIKLCQLIFQYGPTWEKRLEIQRKIRELSDNDLVEGAKTINNLALHPQTAPSTSTLTELSHIDQQTSQNYKRGKLDGYNMLLELLETDVTEEYISKFQKLFKVVVVPEQPLLYLTPAEDDEDIDTMNPQYNTRLFCEFFDSSDDFLAFWKASEFYTLTVEGE